MELKSCWGGYGGHGFSGTLGFFTENMHMRWIIAFLVIIGESFGSIALLAGVLTRFSAASVGIIVLGAISMVHWQHGFLMNCFGKQAGEGFEYHLLVIGICAVLIITGGGKWSLDQIVASKVST